MPATECNFCGTIIEGPKCPHCGTVYPTGVSRKHRSKWTSMHGADGPRDEDADGSLSNARRSLEDKYD